MNRLPLVVVKVGGSLLSAADFAPRLHDWLKQQPPAVHVLIAGGGELADVLRRWDALHGIGEEASHWLCIRALSLTSSILAQVVPTAAQASQLGELIQLITSARRDHLPHPVVFGLEAFLRHEEPALGPIAVPHTWCVTTDSLAARLAEVLGADGLILLKSSLPASNASANYSALAEIGYVDKYFPTIAPRVARVRFAAP
jgi:aspartokinase-like uncharacterized kinase